MNIDRYVHVFRSPIFECQMFSRKLKSNSRFCFLSSMFEALSFGHGSDGLYLPWTGFPIAFQGGVKTDHYHILGTISQVIHKLFTSYSQAIHKLFQATWGTRVLPHSPTSPYGLVGSFRSREIGSDECG